MANEKRLIKIPSDGIIRIPVMRGEDTVGEERIDLSSYPTVDAVEVVRCKDCTQYNGHRYCRYTELIVLDNDFCSYGERKDNES